MPRLDPGMTAFPFRPSRDPGWPGRRRAEATPSFGRLCPAMTSNNSRKHLVERRAVGRVDQFGMVLAQAFHHHSGIDLQDLPAAVDRDDVDRSKANADGACRP